MRSPEARAGVANTPIDGTALVTGSTSGIGKQTALALGRLGAEVIVHGRDQSRGEQVRDQLTDDIGTDAVFYQADFADQDAVRALAEQVTARTDSLSLLVNNAGGLFGGALTPTGTTAAGIEYSFAVNHLAPFVLTSELLPLLASAAPSRIVTVASKAHRGGSLNPDTLESDSVRGFWAYNRSKLANILFTTHLARKLDAANLDVTATAIHPGSIPGSGFTRNLPRVLDSLGTRLNGLFGLDTPEDGAANALLAGLTPVDNGAYISNLSQTTPNAKARDPALQQTLWEESRRLTGVDWAQLS